jgi:translocation protein SEC66
MLGFDITSIDWKGLAFSITYILVLGGALVSFSHVYRSRKAAQSANLAPWFGPHLQRDMYLSLVAMTPDESDKKTESKVPESVLKAALLRRAVEDINRLIQVRSSKSAITNLLARGCVGDDLWQRFQRAEKEMEVELRDVVMEANAYAPNWGQSIFQSAHEMSNNGVLRKRINDIQSQTEAEKEWWEKRRDAIRSDFMKELEEKP